MLYTNNYDSPLGQITLLSDDNYLLGLWFEKQSYYGAGCDINQAKPFANQPILSAQKWLDSYFSGHNPSTKNIPINPEVTEFQNKVLEIIKHIDYGKTATYKEISNNLQVDSDTKRNKSRAIGNAVGRNPILLIIPCHRVIGSNGSLTGYAGGIERKKRLLEMEEFNETR